MVRRKPSKAFLHLREWCSKIRGQQPENPSQLNGNDGFKFAITLIAALLTFSYAMYNHLQNTFVDDTTGYLIAALLWSLAFMLELFLILYIIIKGYSMEVQNPKRQKYLKKLASCIYLISFSMVLVFLVCGLCLFPLACYLKIKIIYAMLVMGIIALCLFLYLRARFFRDVCDKWMEGLFIVYLIAILLAILSVPSLIPTIGHVTVDIGDVCYKNNVPIPVSIQVTGQERELNISIYGEGADHTFVLVDYMELKQYNIFYRNFSKEGYIVGNALGRGKFTVFINTTNLTTGYYVLTCKHRGDGDLCSKDFYLLNNSQPLCVE